MRVVTFDIETANWMSEETDGFDGLNIAITCIHDSETDSYSSYLEHELPRLWPILERTDMLVGYNSNHFDVPLHKYYPGDLKKIKSLDLLAEIRNSLGRSIRLDAVAEGTLGTKKSGSGAQSLQWWRAGEIDKVRQYCLKDVEITKRIFDHALEKGFVKYKELGRAHEVKLDTSKWLTPAAKPMTFSLGL